MKIKYRCTGFRPLVLEECDDTNVGRHFAEKRARKEYGGKGAVGCVRLHTWTSEGKDIMFEAFIGRQTKDGIAGRTAWLHVSAERMPE